MMSREQSVSSSVRSGRRSVGDEDEALEDPPPQLPPEVNRSAVGGGCTGHCQVLSSTQKNGLAEAKRNSSTKQSETDPKNWQNELIRELTNQVIDMNSWRKQAVLESVEKDK